MLIPAVEDALELYLRRTLPLPEDVGDLAFDTPSGSWSAQVNRITVSAFLYSVSRSPQPPRASAPRVGSDGQIERRAPLPLVQLSYLVSAWAGSVRDEHQLLGDVLTRLLAVQVLPDWAVEADLNSSIQVALATDELNRPRDLWGALGGGLKASFTLLVTVASDAYDWEAAPTSVADISARASVLPRPVTETPRTARGR
ncbi:DUF4255 domain-containing protein [Sanguibacter sp. 25GB23B1]|uniref:DUF4255 domain-containing protein n=1 Tax=unclassified Sanguibacter TaxID=2645534 RepID=UPI0032AF98B7